MRRLALLVTALAVWLPSSLEAQTKLEPRLEPGKYREREVTSVKQKLSLNGAPLDTSVDAEAITQVEVGSTGDDKLTPIVFNNEKLTAELGLPGGLSLKFDGPDDGGHPQGAPVSAK